MNLQTQQLPLEIQKLIQGKDYTVDSIGESDSAVYCFGDMFLKVEKEGENSDNEHKMLSWLADKLPVPQILCSVKENGVNYLLMSRMEGRMSCDEEYMTNPRELVRILAEGLKLLWKVDIADCPYNNMLENKLRLAEIAVKAGLCDTENVEPDTYGEGGFASPEDLLQWLKEHKPKAEPVFSHGDYCLPNVFIKDGHISGFIDWGNGGIGDQYQDIALCYRSLLHNYSGKYSKRTYEDFHPEMLFEELGIEPDWEKIRYYILLDELF